MSIIKNAFEEHFAMANALDKYKSDIEGIFLTIKQSLDVGGKLIFCGNGGSAADCQHLAAELTGRFLREREPLPAIALTTDTSALTCIGNDYGFENVFSRQLNAVGSAGDTLIAISTSGNSDNIINAVLAANEKKINTIGFLGRNGGRLAQLCSQSLIVPSESTARIQEIHILTGHVICELIDDGYAD